MRDAEADFQAYVDARWRDLVTSLERNGISGSAARMAVAGALVDCRRGWRGLVRADDIDRRVWEVVRARAGLPPDPGAVPQLAEAAEQAGVDVADPWLEQSRHRAGLRRRVRNRRVARVGVATVLIAGFAGWWVSRPEPPPVREAANPLPVAWYADGELHLDEVVVDLPGVEAFRQLGADVAVRLEDGSTRLVTAAGKVDELARPVRMAPRASGERQLSAADFEILDQVDAPDGSVVRVVLYRQGWDSLVTDRYVAIVCHHGECREHTLEVAGRVRFS